MKHKMLAAALAALFMFPLFGTVAYAGGGDLPPTEVPSICAVSPCEDAAVCEPTPAPEEEAPAGDAAEPVPAAPEPNPFTPAGTGTVVDNATDTEGKEFFTIMTPDEHIFYLVIDRQRETENVYFLNAVTVADLAALAEVPETPAAEPTPAPVEQTPAEPAPAPEQEPEPEQGGGNTTMYIIIAVLALLGGGAAWYFKVYRPKQQGAASVSEYEPPADEVGYDDDWDDEQDETEDGPPWDEDESGHEE